MNLFESLFNKVKASFSIRSQSSSIKNSNHVKQTIVGGNNYGPINENNNYHTEKSTTWIQKRETVDHVTHQFRNFFSLIESINAPASRLLNKIQDGQARLKRELETDQLIHLEEPHQKIIYRIYNEIKQMQHAHECTQEKILDYRSKLKEISDYYMK